MKREKREDDSRIQSLDPMPEILHYVFTNVPKSEELWKSHSFQPQALLSRDVQPVLMTHEGIKLCMEQMNLLTTAHKTGVHAPQNGESLWCAGVSSLWVERLQPSTWLQGQGCTFAFGLLQGTRSGARHGRVQLARAEGLEGRGCSRGHSSSRRQQHPMTGCLLSVLGLQASFLIVCNSSCW